MAAPRKSATTRIPAGPIPHRKDSRHRWGLPSAPAAGALGKPQRCRESFLCGIGPAGILVVADLRGAAILRSAKHDERHAVFRSHAFTRCDASPQRIALRAVNRPALPAA